jgi:carboxyl-terminal processing protease
MKRTAGALISVFLLLAVAVHPGALDEEAWDNGLNKIEDMAGIITSHYFRAVSESDLAQEAIKGMLQTLDPHSYLLEPESFSRMAEEQRGKYYGVGMQILKQEDRLTVVSPIEGTPAWRLGVQAGDVISFINGESTKPISDREAVSRLRGPKGSKVTIVFIREGLPKPFELVIDREEIPLYSVPYAFMLPDGVGYIFVRYFAENTTNELQTKLELLSKQGMTKLILDLRGNAGGALIQAIEISSEFLKKGDVIVSMKGRNRAFDREFPAQATGPYDKVPLVILVDQGSASSSEIVAGAIMDNDRGLIIGADSWGKGLVQQMFSLAPDMAVAITIARYFTPSGRSIQRDYTHLDDYLLDKIAADKPREVRTTVGGRKVLGQGGISPDYAVRFTLHPYTFELRSRGAFFGYARKLGAHQTPLSKTFILPGEPQTETKGKILLAKPFLAGKSVLDDFRAFLQSNKIDYDAKRFQAAEADLAREIEREVSAFLWGQEEGWRAFGRTDPQVRKALEMMPEAAKFIR